MAQKTTKTSAATTVRNIRRNSRKRYSGEEKVYVLESGDSLRFDGRLPHYCQNSGRETAKALILFLDFAEALSSGI